MKKYAMFFAALSAAVMISSCAKEQPVEPEEILSENGLVPMTFTASAENASSKAVLNSDGKTVEWEGSESISVFDDVNDTNHKFDAETSGENTSFTGEVNSSSSSFVAVYPYNAGIVYDSDATNPISYEIPRIQEATLGSFDPKAAVFVSTSDDISKKFTFKAAFALLKVNVDVDDVVAVYAENTGANMSGSVKIGTDGTIEDGTEDMFKYVCLKNSDDSPLSTGTYYIVVRYLDADPLSSFSLTYVKSDAAFKTRVKSSDIDALSRKAILDLGSLSGIPGSEEVSWYKYYQAFLDVKIGSKTINRFNSGDATEYTAENESATVINKGKTETGGVFFLKAVGTGSFELKSSPSITNMVAFLSDKDDNAILTFGGADGTKCAMTLAGGNVFMKSVTLKSTVSSQDRNYFFTVGSATTGNFILDRCSIHQVNQQYFINGSTATNGITNVEIVNSKVSVGRAGGIQIINVSKTSTGIAAYKSFTFNNNYVYSSLTTSTPNITVQVFNHSIGGSDTPLEEAQLKDMSVYIGNNIFYNTVTPGHFKHFQVKSIYASKNLFWVNDATDLGGNPKLVSFKDSEAPSSGLVNDNICFGTLSGGRKWSIADERHRGTIMTNMSKAETSDPIASADVSTGTFTMASGYESYGPQAL